MPPENISTVKEAMQNGYSQILGHHLLEGYQFRAEAKPKHAQVFGTGRRTDQLLIDFLSLEKLDRAGLNVQSYFGPNAVIGSTTMINDRDLHALNLNYECRVVERVAPRFHIGCDVPTYKDGEMDEDVRLNNIEEYLTLIHAQAEYFRDSQITIVPSLLGVNPDEYKKCYHGFRGLPGIKTILGGDFALYVGQMFGQKHGCQIKQLEDELWEIDAICNHSRILLVGYGSPWRVENFPGSVTSMAGLQQFIKRTDFRNTSLATTRREMNKLRDEAEAKLSTGAQQLSFTNFTQTKT